MATSAPSRLDDITPAFSKLDIQKRFGAPAASGKTILGRETETYRLHLTGSSMHKRDAVKFLVLCGLPTSWPICAGYLAVDTVLFPFVYKENEDRKVPIVFVYAPEDRFLYSFNEAMTPVQRYWQAVASLKHPFDDAVENTCPQLTPCMAAFIEEANRRASEVGHEISSEEQQELHRELELASQVDGFEITKKQAGELRRDGTKRASQAPHDVRDETDRP
jgi:hypothetical protein